MTFGFGRDTDEVNGFLPISSGDFDSRSDGSISTYLPAGDISLPPPPVPRGEDCSGRPGRFSRRRGAESSSAPSGVKQGVFFNSRGCREIPDENKIWVRAHRWRPSQDRPCHICREPGHDASNCLQGLMNRAAVAQVECVRGKHFPYLHGVWRCNNCGNHLYDKDVKEQYPEFHAREAAKEWEKMKKYGAPCLSWQ